MGMKNQRDEDRELERKLGGKTAAETGAEVWKEEEQGCGQEAREMEKRGGDAEVTVGMWGSQGCTEGGRAVERRREMWGRAGLWRASFCSLLGLEEVPAENSPTAQHRAAPGLWEET